MKQVNFIHPPVHFVYGSVLESSFILANLALHLRTMTVHSANSREVVHAIRVIDFPRQWIPTLVSLQGLLNRNRPRLYLIWDGMDSVHTASNLEGVDALWREHLESRYGISFDFLNTCDDLFKLAREATDSYVVFDPDISEGINISTMEAARAGALLVHPDGEKSLQQAGFLCRRNLQGRHRGWSRERLYRWAIDEYLPGCAPGLAACLDGPDKVVLRLDSFIQTGQSLTLRIQGIKREDFKAGTVLRQVRVLGDNEVWLDRSFDTRGVSRSAVGEKHSGVADECYDMEVTPQADRNVWAVIEAHGVWSLSVSPAPGRPFQELFLQEHPPVQGGYMWDLQHHLRDYCVAKNLFTFSLSAGPRYPEEMSVRDEMMTRLGPGTVLLGWVTAREDELHYLQHTSRHGGTVVCCLQSPNLSFLQHLDPGPIRLPDPSACPEIKKDKVYVSFIVGDGDAFWQMQSFLGKHYLSPHRGEVHLGWGVQPLMARMFPAILAYYTERATPRDCLVATASGLGYSYADTMKREHLISHLKEAASVLKPCGFRVLQIYLQPRDVGGTGVPSESRQLFDTYLSPEVIGFQEGYWAYHPPAAEKLSQSVWAHTLLPNVEIWGGPRPENFKKALLDLAANNPQRPLFIPTHPWIEEMPFPEVLKLIRELPPEFEVVRPDHLFEMMRLSLSRT